MSFKFTLVPAQSHPGPTNRLIGQTAVKLVLDGLTRWHPYANFEGERKVNIAYNLKGIGSLTFTLDFLYLDDELREDDVKLVAEGILRPANVSENMYLIESVEFGFGNENNFVSINNSWRSGIFYGATYCINVPESALISRQMMIDRSHKKLVELSLQIIGKNKGYEGFINTLNLKEYNKALRRLCTSTADEIPALVCLLLNAKDTLGIDINERAGEEHCNALHYAARKYNIPVYNQLILRGADTTLVNKDRMTGVDIMSAIVDAENSKKKTAKADVKKQGIDARSSEATSKLSTCSLMFSFSVKNKNELSMNPVYQHIKNNFDFAVDLFFKKMVLHLQISYKFLKITFERDFLQETKSVKFKITNIHEDNFKRLQKDIVNIKLHVPQMIAKTQGLNNFLVLEGIEEIEKDTEVVNQSLFEPSSAVNVHYKRDYFGNLLETVYMSDYSPQAYPNYPADLVQDDFCDISPKYETNNPNKDQEKYPIASKFPVDGKTVETKNDSMSKTPTVDTVKQEVVTESEDLRIILQLRYKQNDVSIESIGRALRYAAAKNNYEDLAVILKSGINVDHVEKKSLNPKTALHWAVTTGCVEAAKFLIDAGANKELSDGKKNAIQYAEVSNNIQIKSLFGINNDNNRKFSP